MQGPIFSWSCTSILVCRGTNNITHYILHYVTLRYVTLRYVTLRYVTLHYITLHYITLHYITLHYITLYIILYFVMDSPCSISNMCVKFTCIHTRTRTGRARAHARTHTRTHARTHSHVTVMWVAGRGGTRGRHRSDVSPLRGVWLYRRRHLARQNETLQVGGILSRAA